MKTKHIKTGNIIPTIWGVYLYETIEKVYFEKKDISFLTDLAGKFINNKISADDTLNEISVFFNVSISESRHDVIMTKFYNIVSSL